MTASTRLSMPAVMRSPRTKCFALQDTAIHGHAVVAGGDGEIGPAHQALLVNLVVVNERAARCFATAHTFRSVWAGDRAHVLGENLGMIEQLLQELDTVKHLAEPRVVVVERAEDGSALQFVELSEFLIR